MRRYNSTPAYELYHHGILGQRWGKRNGPPYPLGSSDHSSSEKKAGWRKSLDKNSSKSDTESKSGQAEKKQGLTDGQKKAIKIGAAVVATALVTYGAYKLSQSGELDGLIEKGKSTFDSLMTQPKPSGSADNFVGGIKKLARSENLSDTLKNVNPHLGDSNYKNNCSACGIASFLRSAGYDVTAKSTGGNQQILGGVVEECFKGARVIDGSAVKFGKSRQDAAEMLVKRFGENASGVVSVQWNPDSKMLGGHTFNWSIKDGVVSFFDGQQGRGDSEVSRYWEAINPNDSLTIARLDNAEINFDAIKKYVENR